MSIRQDSTGSDPWPERTRVEGREVRTIFRVRYAETDQMGMAYYANYLVWFEVMRGCVRGCRAGTRRPDLDLGRHTGAERAESAAGNA